MHVTAGTGTGSSSSNQAASRTSVRFSTPSLHSSSPLAPASPRTPASTVRPAAVPPARPAPFFASSFSPRSPQLTLNMVSNDQLAPQGRSYDSPGATVSSQQRRGLLTRAAPPPTTSTSSQYAYWQDQGDMYGYEEQGGAHSYDWQQYIEDDGADQHDGVGGGRGDASQAMVPPSSGSFVSHISYTSEDVAHAMVIAPEQCRRISCLLSATLLSHHGACSTTSSSNTSSSRQLPHLSLFCSAISRVALAILLLPRSLRSVLHRLSSLSLCCVRA